jgi:hypothetical protein
MRHLLKLGKSSNHLAVTDGEKHNSSFPRSTFQIAISTRMARTESIGVAAGLGLFLFLRTVSMFYARA